MPECPGCDSNNVIRTDPVELDYECLDCHYEWVDYLDEEWYDGNDREERNEPAHV